MGGNFMSMAAGRQGSARVSIPLRIFKSLPTGLTPFPSSFQFRAPAPTPVNAKILRFQLGLVKDASPDIRR